MKLAAYQHHDKDVLDRIIELSKMPIPYTDNDGVRIGNVLRLWRDGCFIMADIECVPEDNVERIE